MGNRRFVLLLGVTVLTANTSVTDAHVWYRRALREKYNFKATYCHTCHAEGGDVGEPMKRRAFKSSPYRYFNDFGKQLAPLLEAKKTRSMLQEYRSIDRTYRNLEPEDSTMTGELSRSELVRAKHDAIKQRMIEDFFEALEIVEAKGRRNRARPTANCCVPLRSLALRLTSGRGRSAMLRMGSRIADNSSVIHSAIRTPNSALKHDHRRTQGI